MVSFVVLLLVAIQSLQLFLFWYADITVLSCMVNTRWTHVFLYPPWWRHPMETFSALLAICAGNSPVPGEFPAQRPVTRSFDVFFDLRLNKRLVNNHEAGDLRRQHGHYDVIVMLPAFVFVIKAERSMSPSSQYWGCSPGTLWCSKVFVICGCRIFRRIAVSWCKDRTLG